MLGRTQHVAWAVSACVLLWLTAGDESNSRKAAQDAALVDNLRNCLLDGEDEVSGQAGKVCAPVCACVRLCAQELAGNFRHGLWPLSSKGLQFHAVVGGRC